jgi:glycolate oxidase FAD binding subunit
VPADAVLDALRKVCDDRARAAEDGDAVQDVPARWVASPRSTDEVAEVLTVTAQHELRVVARGSGTKLDWGLPPKALDVVVDVSGLTGVVEHVAGDLVVVVRAGTPVADLQDQLAAASQQLALDVPVRGATVGGTIATATSGPRRLLYGTVRDLLIGVTFVRADGIVAKAGGKVVKNVAGYDFGKLLAGSFGTLGIVTEAVFRLHPEPVATAAVQVELSDPVTAARAAAAVVGSQLVPTAVEVWRRGDGPTTVTAVVDGIEEGVVRRAAAARELLGDTAVLLDDVPVDLADLPVEDGGTLLKATSTIVGVGDVLSTVGRAGAQHGLDTVVRGSAGGVLHVGLPPGAPPERAAGVVRELRAATARHAGTVTVLTAPQPVRDAVDVWGPVPGLALMARLKEEMDPGHLLAPGRFVVPAP